MEWIEPTRPRWRACHNGECQCKMVMADEYPVATITAGAWGDTYPTLEETDGSIAGLFRAKIEMIEYGSIGEALAASNARIAAAAPEMLDALEAVKRGDAGAMALVADAIEHATQGYETPAEAAIYTLTSLGR